MQIVPDLVEAMAATDGPAIDGPDRGAPVDYPALAATINRVANLLSHDGVRAGARVALSPGPGDPESTANAERGFLAGDPTAIFVALGALADGAVVDPDPPGAVDAAALVAPTPWLDRVQTGPGTTPVGYGGEPEDPAVSHLEDGLWGENPITPPAEFGPDAPAVATDETYTQGGLLAASHRVVAEYDLSADDRVVLGAPLTDVGVVVAGVLAPLRAGATFVPDRSAEGTVVVTDDGEAADARVVPASAGRP